MNTLAHLHTLVNEQNLTLPAALAAAGFDDADPAFWQRKLDNYNPAAPAPKRRRSRSGSRRASRRTFRADSVLSSANERAAATAELVDRVNGGEPAREIPWYVDGQLYRVLEVA